MKSLSKIFGIAVSGLLVLAVSGCVEMDPSAPALEAEWEEVMLEAELEEWEQAALEADWDDAMFETKTTGDTEDDTDSEDTIWPDPFGDSSGDTSG